MSTDRGSFAPHRPCNCKRCEAMHGDQADPGLDELIELRRAVAGLKAELALATRRCASIHQSWWIDMQDHQRCPEVEATLTAQRDALRSEVAVLKERRFPIMGGPSIPWRLIAPHDRQAQINHGSQTLERLAERGGLSPGEALAVLEDRPWRQMDPDIAHDLLAAYNEWVFPEIYRAVCAQRDGAITEAIAAKRERDALRAELDSETVHFTASAVEAERRACAELAWLEWAGSKRNANERETAARIAQAIEARGAEKTNQESRED